MLTVRIQEKNHSESIMVLKLKDGYDDRKSPKICILFIFYRNSIYIIIGSGHIIFNLMGLDSKRNL